MATPPAQIEPKQRRAQLTRQRLLDAAVDELLERGYVGVTTQGVAARAGVSRGAQQNHFPHKATLLAAAVRHLADRQISEVSEQLATIPKGRRRIQAWLDLVYEQYSGPLFAASLELSLAVRTDPDLGELVQREAREISRTMQESGRIVFGEDAKPAWSWSTVISTVRGLAILKFLGHPAATVDRQWPEIRRQLLDLLPADGTGDR